MPLFHRFGIFGAADVAFFYVVRMIGVVLRILSALRAFVALDEMTADMVFSGCVNQFIVCFV